MEHKEDEQPNESVYGRRKRILPFVKNTSRIQGQQRHQFAPTLAPIPLGESAHGHGRGHGRGRGRDHGRGQGRNRGRGGGKHLPSVPKFPQFKETNSWEHTSQPTTPEPSLSTQASSSVQLGPGSSHLPAEKSGFEAQHERLDEWAPGTSTLGPQSTTRPPQNPKRPRKRFRPGKNGKHKYDDRQNTTNANSRAVEPSIDRHLPSELTGPLHDDDTFPPAKRPRIKEEETSPSRSNLFSAAQDKVAKSEIEDDPATDLLRENATSGTKFVSYNDHPMCRFNCGELPSQVRKHRKALKVREVQVLRDQDKEVLAAFIRDDGIAIDWVVPKKSDVSASIPNSMSLIIHDHPEPSSPPPSAEINTPTLHPSRPLPSHLNPLVTSTDESDGRRSSTPANTATEIAYREVLIPPRHLPRDGSTRKLEIWALEQMRLLEAELGPVVLPPPEFIGIGGYATRQKLPEGVHPHIKIRYKQTVRVQPPFVEPSTNSEGTSSLAKFMGGSPATSPVDTLTAPLPSIDLPEPTMPLISHLETVCSPTAPSDSPPIKNEVDELADNPPSVPSSPNPVRSVAERAYTPVPSIQHLNENTTDKPRVMMDEETPQITDSDVNQGSDELQRLRRDLELSRLEAERKHRELEQRILELSQKRSETHTPIPNVEQPSTAVRIADEEKPSIIPLRRGKYDKTRRLLAVSDSGILHISWLGLIQLADRDSRRIVATGFESSAPSNISVEDACLLSSSSTALALSGSESQLAIATLGEGNFSFLPLRDHPHDAKGVCTIASVDRQSAISLGHDHRYIHWKFQQEQCSTDLLSLPKLHSCTALAFDPVHSNIVTAGSESNKRSKLTLHNLADSKQIPNTVELSNHPHHIHVDSDNPFLLILELARLDDQFQVHDIRMPLYQCVQKFGYQNVVHEKAEFRVRGGSKGNYCVRGDTGIVRLWDRRSPKSHQMIPVIPHQKVVDVILSHTSISCATEAHHIVTYPIL